MRLVKLTLLDALYVCRNMRASDLREASATSHDGEPEALAMSMIQSWGPFAFAALADDGTPVAVIGGTQQWPGVWTCWMLATDRFNEIGKVLTRWVKRAMIPQLIERGAHRIEAYSIDGHDTAHRWLRFCGAVQEARLRRYGRGGEDFLVFSVPVVSDAHVPE
jgi:hypothetical protein